MNIKHAMIILAHTDTAQLSRLLDSLDEDFYFFVHLDRKMNKKDVALLKKNKKNNVYFFSWRHITWGGINIIKTQLQLIKEAFNIGNFDYFHFLSGQDYPISKLSEIKSWFMINGGKQYIEYHALPYEKWEHGTFHRFQLYRLNDWFDYSSKFGKIMIDKVNSLQLARKIYRKIPDQYPKLYGGSNWMSITGDCAEMLLNADKNAKSFLNRLRFTFASDEVYFHTVIMNSQFAGSVINDNKRYIKWVRGAVKPLEKNDVWQLITSDALFARKFTSVYSVELLDELPIILSKNIKENYSYLLGTKIIEFCSILEIRSIFDLNSGVGLYVKQFRNAGINAHGFTPSKELAILSSKIFNNGFRCQYTELYRTFEIEIKADLTMGIFLESDLFSNDYSNLFFNLIHNSKKYIIIGYIYNNINVDKRIKILSKLNDFFKSKGVRENMFVSKWMSIRNSDVNDLNIIVYEKI